jgi:hypothetical protein
MGILVIIIVTILQWLRIIIHHKSNFILNHFLLFVLHPFYRNPNIGLTTKAREGKGLKRCEPRMKPESHISWSRECRKMWRDKPPTLPNEFPLWELESQWIFESLEGDCKGQNSLDWKVCYIIGKYKLWPQKRLGVKLSIWLPIIKNRELPWFPYIQVMCHYCWKDLKKGYNFALNLTSIGGLHTKLWASKAARILI